MRNLQTFHKDYAQNAPVSSTGIEVKVKPLYLAAESDPQKDRYVFAYTVCIKNNTPIGARLLRRHWFISDAHGNTQEVKGEGVVGEQPFLSPGERFVYTSGTILKTPVGCMYGNYHLISEAGETFDAEIPAFSLATPNTLH